MIQDMLDGGRIGDEGNDPHRSATMGTNEWKYLEDTGKKGGPEVMGMATGERFGVFLRVLSPLRQRSRTPPMELAVMATIEMR